MSEIVRATIFRTGPMDIEQAIAEIIEAREVLNPQDMVVAANKISFPEEEGIVVSLHKDSQEFVSFLESGLKSMCLLLGFPFHLVSKLLPVTRAAVFTDLFQEKFVSNSSKNYLQLRCAFMESKNLRAIFANKQKVFNDRDVFTSVAEAVMNFDVMCYWVDDYVSAIRFRAKDSMYEWQGRKVFIGFDVVNSEVRERSLEVRGVMWLGDSTMIVPKLVYPLYRGRNNRITDIRNLLPCVENFSEAILRGDFNRNAQIALREIENDKISLGRELKNFYAREIFVNLDVLRFLELVKKKTDKKWNEKDMYELCDMEENIRLSKLEFIDAVAKFADGFDTYFKRATLEFGLNLLF